MVLPNIQLCLHRNGSHYAIHVVYNGSNGVFLAHMKWGIASDGHKLEEIIDFRQK